MQALLAAEIQRRFGLDHIVARINGEVGGERRQAIVDAFQSRGSGFDAMILSPKAGGVGLTLTAANHVVHLSRWWNPAVEDQATDRAYRIGQTRDVTVYLPQAIHPDPGISPTSFDLKLHELMDRKRALSRGLLAPNDDEADAAALFEAVVTEAAETPSEPIEAEQAPEPPPAIRRPLLSISKRSSSPLSAPDLPSPVRSGRPSSMNWPKRIVYLSGGARDHLIFRGPVTDDRVDLLEIRDPYACADDRARRHVIEFVAMMKSATKLEAVRLIAWDGDSLNNRVPESNDYQYNAMQACWQAKFAESPNLHHLPVSRRSTRNFHDRSVRASMASGRTLIWDLGHGLDGVMNNRFECVVNLTEE